MPEWVWQPETQTYRDETGRVVTAEQVREWVLESIRKSGDAVTELARLLAEGKLSLEDWRRLMRQEIKDQYVALFLLGLGGLALLTLDDILLLAELLREQFAFLDNFAREAELLSEAQIGARARNYIRSSEAAFWSARQRAAVAAGMEKVKWTLTPAEHCEDCMAFAVMGWQRSADNPYGGAVPKSGATRCLFNCACILLFR